MGACRSRRVRAAKGLPDAAGANWAPTAGVTLVTAHVPQGLKPIPRP
jgi:hypothetical protein